MPVKDRRARAKNLTDRDTRLMRWLGQNGIASLDQLQRVFWPETQPRTARDRLLQLEKAGYLTSHYLDLRRPGELVLCLTARGANLFLKEERRRFMVGLPAAYERYQQLLAGDGRIALERQWAGEGRRLVDWLHERELRSHAARHRQLSGARSGTAQPEEIPDAEAVIMDQAGRIERISIECDGDYHGQMLRQKIAGFARTERPTIWLTHGQRRGQRLTLETGQYSNITVLVV